jgi:exoribonuclease-2
MIERGFLADFSAAVMAEVSGLAAADASHGAPRDLRARLWASIDNDDSRDLDQLTVAEPLAGGAVKILVAVADVDAVVEPASAVDGHARHNTTSVYTPGAVFPMLPTRLSTDLTSLNEGEDRAAVVVEMVVAADGTIGASSIARAVVRNHAKLAYDGVAAWLDGGPAPARVSAVPGLDAQLRLQDGVAQRLKSQRRAHGALTLETMEARAVFDGDQLTALRPDEKNRVKELIEEFMIAANGVTARFLAARGFPSVRRVLRSPERWARIVDVAAQLGATLPAEPDAAALDRFLAARRAADAARFPDLSLTIVKLLGSGEYQVEWPGATATGHFALAVEDYTHSTAPNRRYPDVITQRLLKAALAARPVPYAPGDLDALARHCTEREDAAKKVERQVRKSAAALLLEPSVGRQFDGIVTGASDKGTWVRIFQPPVEGKVVRGGESLDVGDRVRVELVGTDVERGYIDFASLGRSSAAGPR